MLAEKAGWNFKLDEKYEKWIIDGIIFGALGIFMYNRKLAKDEKKAKEAAENAALDPQPQVQDDDDTRPHWERRDPGDEEDAADEGDSQA
jgi:hypothetical protein